MLALIVDDSRSSVAQLQRLIEGVRPIETRACLNPDDALAAAEHQAFNLIVVDHVMPRMDGVDLITALRRLPLHERTPILMVTASAQLDVRLAALEAGANDVLQKSSHPVELRSKIRNLLMLADAVAVLDKRVAGLAEAVEEASRVRLAREEEMIFRLSKAVEFRDNDTGDHTLRVATYSRMIAAELGFEPEFCRRLFLASPLHDIGKVAVPDRVLLKAGRLDADEMALIRTHAGIGERILEGSQCETIQLAAEIAGNHHERWDGTGYPAGRSGDTIPISAQIVAVADVFDALTSNRPYKQAMAVPDALALIESESGKHFDPRCVGAFLRAYGRAAGTPPTPGLPAETTGCEAAVGELAA